MRERKTLVTAYCQCFLLPSDNDVQRKGHLLFTPSDYHAPWVNTPELSHSNASVGAALSYPR